MLIIYRGLTIACNVAIVACHIYYNIYSSADILILSKGNIVCVSLTLSQSILLCQCPRAPQVSLDNDHL